MSSRLPPRPPPPPPPPLLSSLPLASPSPPLSASSLLAFSAPALRRPSHAPYRGRLATPPPPAQHLSSPVIDAGSAPPSPRPLDLPRPCPAPPPHRSFAGSIEATPALARPLSVLPLPAPVEAKSGPRTTRSAIPTWCWRLAAAGQVRWHRQDRRLHCQPQIQVTPALFTGVSVSPGCVVGRGTPPPPGLSPGSPCSGLVAKVAKSLSVIVGTVWVVTPLPPPHQPIVW
jgi:hypothetical protein